MAPQEWDYDRLFDLSHEQLRDELLRLDALLAELHELRREAERRLGGTATSARRLRSCG